MDVFEKIRAQQPKERTPVWMVGEQLADIIRHNLSAQEIVSRDLDTAGMSLADCEKKSRHMLTSIKPVILHASSRLRRNESSASFTVSQKPHQSLKPVALS